MLEQSFQSGATQGENIPLHETVQNIEQYIIFYSGQC